jgi:hypothetical protein
VKIPSVISTVSPQEIERLVKLFKIKN